jgi:hypothetical protein
MLFAGICSYRVDHEEAKESLMLSRIVLIIILGGLLAGGAASGAQAQQPVSLGQQATNPSGWTFNVAPYLWFAHINTTMNLNLPPALDGTVSADSTIGFGDLVSHLNFGLMVAADARHDRFSLLSDFMYLNLGGTASNIKSVNFPGRPAIPISGALQTSAGLNTNAKIWTLAGGYTVAEGGWGNFDMIVGFRYLDQPIRINYDLALTLTGPRGNGATFGGIGSVSGTSTLWNGIGGLRGRIRLDVLGSSIPAGLFIPYYFDVGTGGSNLTWQIASGLGYQTRWADVSLTYRYLSFEQGGSAVVQHIDIGGPMIMANFSF